MARTIKNSITSPSFPVPPHIPKFARRKWSENFGGFTQVDRDKNIEAFCANPDYKKLWERLEEAKVRMPWTRHLIESLEGYAASTSKMTDKQMSLATSLYIDCCMTSDDKVTEQTETRKLGYRLLELELGQARHFVSSVMYSTDTRPLTGGQIRAIRNIANRVKHKLSEIPPLTDEEFDGWFKKTQPPKEIDAEGRVLS